MLIICNGSFKTGSTLLYNAVSLAYRNTSVPTALRNSWVNESVDLRDLRELAHFANTSDSVYVVKTHFYNPIVLERQLQDCRSYLILNTDRNPVDILISSYFHFVARGYRYRDFASYCRIYGFYALKRHQRYLDEFRESDLVSLVFAYDDLVSDPEKVVTEVGKYIKASPSKINGFNESLDVKQLRLKYSERMGSDAANSFFLEEHERKERKFSILDSNPNVLRDLEKNVAKAYWLKSYVLRVWYGIIYPFGGLQ